MTSEHIDRAAEAIYTEVPGLSLLDRLRAARALADAGLLVTPEHDAAVAALPLPDGGCVCTPHEQDAGGGHTEYLLEYEPACPEHSEHLWDPKRGMWVLRSEHDAEVAARTLRDVADEVGRMLADDSGCELNAEMLVSVGDPEYLMAWLRAHASEREAGESGE